MWFVVLLLLPAFAAAQQTKVESEIQTIMDKHEVVGLSVAVVRGGKIDYAKTFGLKDVEKNIPLGRDDIFRIASVSKSFTVTAMMRLIEDGKISLDDDIGNLIGFKVRNPAYPDKVITLRMILSHTSSLNDSQGYFTLDVIDPSRNPAWANSYNTYAPGSGYEYCNLAFNMAGAVVERITKERFDVHIRKTVLQPLGLYGGYCVDSLDSERFVTLYEYDSVGGLQPSPMAYAPRREEISRYVMGYSTPIFSPTGGMKMSASDLARYMIMHMNMGAYEGGRVISRKSARIMQTQVANEEGYGLALMNLDDLIPGKTMTGHTGSAYGLFSAMFFHRKEKFGFVVITNGCRPSYSNGVNNVLRETITTLYDNFIGGGNRRLNE